MIWLWIWGIVTALALIVEFLTSDLVTVIFPYATIQSGDEEDTSDEVIQLQEKYIYSDNHKNYNNLKIVQNPKWFSFAEYIN